MHRDTGLPLLRHILLSSPGSLFALPDPDPEFIDIFEIDIPEFAHDADRYRSWLSRKEMDRAGSFVSRSAGAWYILSCGIRRELLGRYLRVAPDRIRFGYSHYGKPFIGVDGSPDLSFNTSHSGEKLLLGICRERDIGVDIQQISDRVSVMEIAGRFFGPADTAFLASCRDDERHPSFFRIWAFREAYCKARGLGLSLPMEEIPPMHSLSPEITGFPAGGRMWYACPVPVSGPYMASVIISERNARRSQRA